MDIKTFILQHKVIAIYRKVYGDTLLRAATALCEGGIKLMEVTFDQADPDCIAKTSGAIEALYDCLGDRMRFGAGTVLTKEQVRAAKAAGAQYIISPNTDTEIIELTNSLGMLSIPGAMTPTEILAAHNAGAGFVKLFPAGYLGHQYIKDIMAPINHIGLIATGGVNEETLAEYLRLGFAGAGVSGRLSQGDLLQNGDFAELSRRAAEFARVVGSAGGGSLQ